MNDIPTIELTIDDDRWNALDLAALARRALSGALAFPELGVEMQCEVSLLATDDARIAELNGEFRGRPAPTNVLSWPAQDLAPQRAGERPAPPRPDFTGEIALGDIAISFDTCAREASAAGKPMEDHVTHLLVHGLLHLLGYDHVRDPDATLMEGLETRILGRLGIEDPYRE